MFVKPLLRQPVRILNINSTRLLSTKITDDLVLTKEVNDKGLCIFNRPNALNAVTLEMTKVIEDTLNKWKDTKSLIIVRGNGGKAFCAGGDVKTVIESGLDYGLKLIKAEYSTNHMIWNMKIPYVALIDGIVMGGGVGYAVHGKYRVATEKTVFAMPETRIGLFPDIGASYFLPRMQGKLGYYLGLTGSSIRGSDVFHSGIATHYCESAKIPDLEQALLHLDDVSDVENLINNFCSKPQSKLSLAKHMDQINKCFDAKSVEEIVDNLERDGSDWAKKTLKILRSVSPTSLKVVFRQFNLGEKMSLGECLQLDYRLAYHFFIKSDFHEGVRTLLNRKDEKPKWNPQRFEEIPIHRVHSFFEPLPNNDELPIPEKLRIRL